MSQVELTKIQPRYLFLDPASGKGREKIKSVRARSAIVVIGMDVLQRIWVLDAWADRAGTNEIVKHFVDMSVKWGPIICGYEDVGQQSLLVDPILEKAGGMGVDLPLTPVGVSTKIEKKWRIRALLQPVIGAGRLMIREDLVELRNELTSFPMNVRMDLVDALATAVSLTPPIVSLSSVYDEKRELAKYLRDSGLGSREIEEQMEMDKGFEGGGRDEKVVKWWHELTKKGEGIRARS
jgi:hypothetical protein